MQRLSGVADHEAEGLALEIIESSNLILGRTANLVRILAKHSPFLARWYLGFVGAVRQPTLGASTDIRIRNLVCIKTSMVNQCAYCTAHTSLYGQALGLSEAEIEVLAGDGYRSSALFSDRDKAAIAWAEAMTRNTAARDQQVWEDLRRQFTDTEIVELSLNICLFNMANRLNDSFWTELEPEEFNRRQGRAIGLSIDAIEDYAARFPATGRAERERRNAVAGSHEAAE